MLNAEQLPSLVEQRQERLRMLAGRRAAGPAATIAHEDVGTALKPLVRWVDTIRREDRLAARLNGSLTTS